MSGPPFEVAELALDLGQPVTAEDLGLQGERATAHGLVEALVGWLDQIATSGGEMRWSWDKTLPPLDPATHPAARVAAREQLREGIADLTIANVVEELDSNVYLGAGITRMRLTDKGRNLVEKHRRRRITASRVA